MGRSLRLSLLAACLAMPAAAQEPAYTPPRPPVREVVIHRGGAADPVGAVPVHRGSAVAPAWAAPAGTAEALGDAEQPARIAGRNLWLVDPEDGRLTACQVRRTLTVGQRRIACVSRRLPD